MAVKYFASIALSAIATSLVAAAAVAWLPMQVFEESYAMFRHVKETTLADGPGARILIVGDSRAKAGIDPARLNQSALSLTLPGGSPIELYYTLQRYLSHHAAPTHVVLSFSAVHLDQATLFWERTVKFDYLEESQYAEVLRTAELMHDPAFGSPLQARWTYLVLHNNAPHMYLPELRSALFRPRSFNNERMFAELSRHGGHCFFGRAARSSGLSFETAKASFEPSRTVDEYFHRLLDLLRTSGVDVWYQAMPLNRESLRHLTPAFVERYDAYFARLARAYPDVHVSAAWPMFPDEDFGDANHLNERGCEEMTRIVREALSSDWTNPTAAAAAQVTSPVDGVAPDDGSSSF